MNPKIKNIVFNIISVLLLCSLVVSFILLIQYDKEKKSHLESQVALQTVQSQYKGLVKQYEVLEQSFRINEAKISELNEIINSKNKEVSAIGKTVENKVQAIIKKYDNMDKTETNRMAMEREISAERIRGLWAVFCIENKEHQRCK